MRNIILLCCLGFLFSACSDFLEERSQNMAYVETINDLDELLVGEVYFGRDANGGQDPQGYPPHSKGWTSIASSRFISHFLMDDDIEEFACGPNDDGQADWLRSGISD